MLVHIKNLLLSLLFIFLGMAPALAQENAEQTTQDIAKQASPNAPIAEQTPVAASPTSIDEASPSLSASSTPAHHEMPQDLLAECRAYYVDGAQEQASRCLKLIVAASDNPDEQAAASEMLKLISVPTQGASETLVHGQTKTERDEVKADKNSNAKDEDEAVVSVGDVISSGAPELMLTSTVFGSVHGFLAMASLHSALRTSTDDSFGSLLASPVLGAAGGLAFSYGVMQWFKPSPGDVAMISSAMFWGTAYGTYAQGLWELSADPAPKEVVHRIPLRFALVLGSGLLSTGVATVLGPYLDVSPGDMGLANSAGLWGGLWTFLTMATFFSDQMRSDLRTFMMPLLGSVLSYGAVFALSPLVHISRPATWLIEAGALAGGLIALGLSPIVALASNNGMAVAYMGWGGLSLGLAAGTASAFLVDKALDDSRDGDKAKANKLAAVLEHVVVVPTVLAVAANPDRRQEGLVYGLTLAAGF